MSSEKEILALEDKRFAAMIGGDWKTVQGLAHDQLLYTHSSAITDTKATWLESMKSGRVKYKKANCSEQKVQIYGDTALITGRANIEAETADSIARTGLDPGRSSECGRRARGGRARSCVRGIRSVRKAR